MEYRIEVLNKTPVGCVVELGEKGTEFTIVAGRIIRATNSLKTRREK